MSADDFEKRLQGQSLRQVPTEWRTEILSAARQAAAPQHASRPTPHAPSLLSTLRKQLSALLWPRPVAWAGLAAVWLVILGLNVATRAGSSQIARRASPATPQAVLTFHEQARLLAELLGPSQTPVAERPKVVVPRPRSERRLELPMV